MGRPKGSRSLGIPIRGLAEAIDLTKILYEKVGKKHMSYQELAGFLGLRGGSSFPVVGALSEYGFIEKIGEYWKVSDTGELAIKEDIPTLKHALERNPVFKDLLNQFKDKEVTPGAIENHLRKKYKKRSNVHTTVNRFLKSKSYIDSLEKEISDMISDPIEPITEEIDLTKWIKLIKLKYALNPPKETEINKLFKEVVDVWGEEDVAISTLSKSIEDNKENKEIQKVLIKSLIDIIVKKYPMIDDLKETKKKEEIEEVPKEEENDE